jgi:hypothetical protein
MKYRIPGSLLAFSLIALGSVQYVRSEVYAVLDASGQFVETRISPAGRGVRGGIWEPTGAAPAGALVLNPNGDLRGDGRPDIAVNPVTGLPRAVWASRMGQHYQVVTAEFDGQKWLDPAAIAFSAVGDSLAPKIAFTPQGVAVVVWWVRDGSPTVRMAISSRSHPAWMDLGVQSEQGERASEPAITQEGSLTIFAYRTPRGIRIQVRTITSPEFGDGPAPFPYEPSGPGIPPTGDPVPD